MTPNELGDYRNFIREPEARALFDELVEWAGKRFALHLGPHGYIARVVRFGAGPRHPLSFIVNRQWLTFYFRASSRSRPYANAEFLGKHFGEVKEARGEVRVRLRTVRDGREIMSILSLG